MTARSRAKETKQSKGARLLCALLLFCALLPLSAFPSRADAALGSVYDLTAPDASFLRRGEEDYLSFPYRRDGENVCGRVYRNTPDLYYAEALSLPFFSEDADGDPLPAIATLTLLFSDGQEISASAASDGDGAARVSADLRSLAGERQLASLSVSFKLSAAPEGARCFVGAPAADAETSAAFAERFFCRSFTADKGSVITGDGGTSFTAHFYGAGALIEGNAGARVAGADTNALRISVASCSRSFELAIYCLFEGEETFSDEPSAVLSLVRSESEQICFAEIRGAGEAKKLRFVSRQNGLSTVVFTSILAVSTYAPGSARLGDVSSCRLSADGESILVRGSLPSSLAVRSREEKLFVYALLPEEDPAAVLSSEPAASGPVSVRFEFRIPLSGRDDPLLSRKFVVLLTEGGVPTDPPLLLDTPFYVSPAAAAGSDPPSAAAFKGVLCGRDGAFADSEPGAVILDVDLTRLCDLSGGGYAVRSGGNTYYFDRRESDRLRARIAEFSACGVPVSLRLLASNPGKSVPFTYSHNESGVFFYALRADSEESRAFLDAATVYLLSDLAGSSGTVVRLILGTNTDSSGEYNFMGADIPLDRYAESYLLALRTVAAAARRCRPGILLCVPIDDKHQNENVGRKFLFPDYDVSLFLEALSARAADEGGGLAFSVLIASSGAPSEEAPDPFSLRETAALLSDLNAKYGVIEKKPLLLWSPAETDDPAAVYSLLYYRALLSDTAQAFFLDLSAGGEDLLPLVRAVDTVRTLNATAAPLARLGVRAEELDGFDGARLVLRDVREADSLSPLPAPTGSAVYRSFAERAALSAVLPAGETEVAFTGGAVTCSFPAGGGSVVLSFPEISLFSCAKALVFSFECDTIEKNTAAELLFLCGESAFRVSVPAENGRFVLDTAALPRLADARAAVFSLSGQATVRLVSFSGESDTLSDAALAAAVQKRLSGRAVLLDPSRAEWGLLLLALVAISGASAFLMRRKKKPDDPGADRPSPPLT
ncbi:MAG: hypothetical protein II771_05870 [Clostridia bacterium]|nr:hypothetical protein [Clostridia bacterium]